MTSAAAHRRLPVGAEVQPGDGVHFRVWAPPENRVWDILWSSEHPRYGGGGTGPLETEENWRLPGHAAVALAPRQAPPEEAAPPAQPQLTGRPRK